MARSMTETSVQPHITGVVHVTPATRFVVAAIGALAAAGAPAAESQDWPLLGRNADMQHNSPLQAINEKNVANLGRIGVLTA